jgi:O-antigen ligase
MLVLENPKALSKKMALAWLGFFLTGLYGIALSPQKADAVRLYLAWVSNFCVFTAAFYVVKNERDFIFCLRLILWASVGPSLYMLYEIFMNVDAVASGGFRVKSSFTHPNIFAFFLMLVIIILPYLISRAQTESSPWRRSILVLYMLVLVAGIGLTQTRSAWLACAAVFVCYGIIFRRRYLFYILSIAILCLFVPVIRDRLVDLGSGNEIYTEQAKLNSFAWRVALWESALFWMEPVRYLLGYGIGAFREYAPVFFARSDGIHWDAHNVYVQWFFDVGILGLCCYVWIHVRTIFTLRHLLAMDRSIAFTIIAIVLSYMLISFSDNMMFYLAFNWYYWFAVGAACALVHATVMVPKSRLDSKSS